LSGRKTTIFCYSSEIKPSRSNLTELACWFFLLALLNLGLWKPGKVMRREQFELSAGIWIYLHSASRRGLKTHNYTRWSDRGKWMKG
jgi:hypothetical protein